MPKKRNVIRKAPKPLLHILCEGEQTEPNYLNYYLKLVHGNWQPRVLIKIEDVEENEPISLVKRAVQLKKESRHKDDIFWCIYDRESPAKYSDERHTTAREIANKNNINVALSNVCFEVWVLLHKQPGCGPYDAYRDLKKHSNLTHFFEGYDKNYQFNLTKDEICNARENAKRMNMRTLMGSTPGRDAPHQLNPYTDVYKVLDAIDAFVVNNS